jgi:hypothetical protein
VICTGFDDKCAAYSLRNRKGVFNVITFLKSKTILMVFSALELFVGFSFSQENMTNAANETGATMGGNQTNQTRAGSLE